MEGYLFQHNLGDHVLSRVHKPQVNALALSLGRLELKDDFGGRAVMHEDAES